MTEPIRAFLIHEQPEPFRELEGILNDLSVETWSVKTCDLAEGLIARHQPLLAFIEEAVWDRSFAQLANLARTPDLALNLIVVGTVTDVENYVSSIKQGAFSFIAPPFDHDRVNIIVHSAAMDARERRELMTHALAMADASHD